MKNPHKVKVVLLGSDEHKRVFRNAISDKNWDKEYFMGLGSNFVLAKIIVDECQVDYHIWDLAGQTQSDSRVREFYRSSKVVMLLHNTETSLSDDLKYMVKNMVQYLNEDQIIVIFLKLNAPTTDNRKMSTDQKDAVTKFLADCLGNQFGLLKFYQLTPSLDAERILKDLAEILFPNDFI